jgi:hypothetical protein|tara:strand:- start:18265 stop:18420 length:156 start_codon:yes stop_codon:yes gene_type:complete
MPDLMSIVIVVQTVLILWLVGKVDRLEKDIEFKLKVPMYALFRHLEEEHNK